MAAVVSPASAGFVSRFRRTVVGALALSLLVSCSHTPSAGTSEAAKPPTTAAQPARPSGALVERKDEAAAAPVEAAPAPEAAAPAAPPPAKESSRSKPKVAISSGSPADGLGLSGVGAGGGGLARGQGYGVGSGRLGGAHARKALAPAPAATAVPIERDAEMNTENYAHVAENPFLSVANQPLSTFSVDVDTASYANSRRFLAQGSLPPKDAIRIEEWINYFAYDYAQPTGSAPFAVASEVTSCPWNAAHKLVRIGIKGKEMAAENVPPRNLVFLLDVSGSMMSADKLPLVKRGMAMLAD
jgi:hypothetical protein